MNNLNKSQVSIYSRADHVDSAFKAGSDEKKATFIYSSKGFSFGFQRERLKFHVLDGEAHLIAIQILKPQERSKEWFNYHKYFWKPLKISDEQGKEMTVLVNVNSAIKRLRSLGLSENKIKEAINDRSLSKMVKYINITHCFKDYAFAEDWRHETAQARKQNNQKEGSLFEYSVEETQTEEITQKLIKWHEVSDSKSASKLSSLADRELIEQNRRINHLLQGALEERKKDVKIMQETRFKVIVDSRGHLQGAALFKINQKRKGKTIPLSISYISTAPWNLRIDANRSDFRKVEGAATALIESAIFESLKTGSKGAVTLEAVSSAVGFYEKMGFKTTAWTHVGGLISMKLSVEAAQEFLASQKAGRALPTPGG